MHKFSFKKNKRETGLRAVANPFHSTMIKLNKKECGVIKETIQGWAIYFFIKNDDGGHNFRKLKGIFDSENDARIKVREIPQELVDRIYTFDE